MAAPLTSQRLGSTACPGCERSLAGQPTTEVEGAEPVRNRYGGFSDGRTRRTTRRWHTACLEEHEAANAAYRRQVVRDRAEVVRTIAEGAGWSAEAVEEAVAKTLAAGS
jgi:hypothetical protein